MVVPLLRIQKQVSPVAGTTPLPGRPVRGSRSGRPVMALLDLLGRRWTLRIVWELRESSAPTFREMQQRCGGISSSVLTTRLRELAEADIVTHDDAGYALTPIGRELLDLVIPLERWSARWHRMSARR